MFCTSMIWLTVLSEQPLLHLNCSVVLSSSSDISAGQSFYLEILSEHERGLRYVQTSAEVTSQPS